MQEAPLIPMPALESAAGMLRVLAHPHRLRMVELLLRRRLPVGRLAQLLGLAPNAVSQHLNQMKAHGILAAQRRGRTVYYRVVHPNARTLIGCIRRHCV